MVDGWLSGFVVKTGDRPHTAQETTVLATILATVAATGFAALFAIGGEPRVALSLSMVPALHLVNLALLRGQRVSFPTF